MKTFLTLTIFLLLVSSCAELPTYGSNPASKPMCYMTDSGFSCFRAHNSYDVSGLHKMYPIDVQGLPPAPSSP